MKNLLAVILLFLSCGTIAADRRNSLIDWQPWSAAAFDEAKQTGKLVLLDLEAVWCHWCHVMDQKTYADETVAAIIREHFVPVKVDHDARPDLANRYRDYGWPATVVLNEDGEDIVKRAGYIAPQPFARLLRAVVNEPSPEGKGRRFEVKAYAGSAILSDELERELLARHDSSFDWQLGGYRSKKKTMDRDSTEYALERAAQGDEQGERMARLTIDASMALIDPEWGGAYQYSTRGDWNHPHYEKVMAVQAGFLRIYALAYMQWNDPRYLKAALAIERYLSDFLTAPAGAYYTSQDADLVQGQKGQSYFAQSDARRRELGIPRIDTNIYARENGWAIEAMASLYEASNDEVFLAKATRAANWIVANRSLPGGGFSHDTMDANGPYLADTLNMGRAFLQLYRAGGERRWLTLAVEAGEYIDRHFRQGGAGFVSGANATGPLQPVPNIDENVSATRFLNLLAHYSGKAEFRAAAEHGMRYLATPEVATRRIEEGGILLAAREMATDPAHFTVVGAKSDASAADLYEIARQESGWYKRLEWWDLAEGPLPNPDVRYPSFSRSAAFVCVQSRCSLPAFDVAEYRRLINQLTAVQR